MEGFLDGLTFAVRRLREEGHPQPAWESELETARTSLRRGDLAAATEQLSRVDDALALRRGESELTEFPRGLVGYVPVGDRGRPLDPDEEALAHRRRLVLHLADLTPMEAAERAAIQENLRTAEQAIAERDRVRAKRLIDAAHSRIEARLRDATAAHEES